MKRERDPILERVRERVPPPGDAFDRLEHRREAMATRSRIAAVVVGLSVTAVLVAGSILLAFAHQGEQAVSRPAPWPAFRGGSWPAHDGWSRVRIAPQAEDLVNSAHGVLLHGTVDGERWELDWTSAALAGPENDEEYAQVFVDAWTVSGPYAQPHAFHYSSDSPGATDGFPEVPRDTPMRLDTYAPKDPGAGFSVVAGVVSPDVARVEVAGSDGVAREVPLVVSPTGRFAYFVFFPPPEVSGLVRALGVDGSVLVTGRWCNNVFSSGAPVVPTDPSFRFDISSCSGGGMA